MSRELIISKEDLFNYKGDDYNSYWLNLLFERRRPKNCPVCDNKKFSKTKNKRSFHCSKCAWRFHPFAGTIFEKTLADMTQWNCVLMEVFHDPNISISDFNGTFGGIWQYETSKRLIAIAKDALVKDGFNILCEKNIQYKFLGHYLLQMEKEAASFIYLASVLPKMNI